MNGKWLRTVLVLLLALLLLVPFGCKKKEEAPTTTVAASEEVAAEGVWAEAIYRHNVTFGTGAKTVKLKVVAEEKSIEFTVHTDAATLGAALTPFNLIAGEASAYGLYVKKVNGIKADYNEGGWWWCLTKGGEMLMTGVDSTEIADGETYEFTRTK